VAIHWCERRSETHRADDNKNHREVLPERQKAAAHLVEKKQKPTVMMNRRAHQAANGASAGTPAMVSCNPLINEPRLGAETTLQKQHAMPTLHHSQLDGPGGHHAPSGLLFLLDQMARGFFVVRQYLPMILIVIGG